MKFFWFFNSKTNCWDKVGSSWDKFEPENQWVPERTEVLMPEWYLWSWIVVFNKLNDRREDIRFLVENIIMNARDKNVSVSNFSNWRRSYETIIDISEWWLRLLSKSGSKSIWEKLKLEFSLGVHKFSLFWEVKNQTESKEWKTQYWIKFFNVPADQMLALTQLLSSIKLRKQII